MNFLEQEMKKILKFSQMSETPTFLGRACYIRMNGNLRMKLEFSGSSVGTYDRLNMEMLNRKEGLIDKNIIRFEDIFGKKAVSNPNFKEGIVPHMWTYRDTTEWYAYKPVQKDYQKLAEVVDQYIQLFQELGMEQGPQMSL